MSFATVPKKTKAAPAPKKTAPKVSPAKPKRFAAKVGAQMMGY